MQDPQSVYALSLRCPCTQGSRADSQQAACMCAQVLAELAAIKRVLSRDLKPASGARSNPAPDSPAQPAVMRQLPTPFQVEAGGQ